LTERESERGIEWNRFDLLTSRARRSRCVGTRGSVGGGGIVVRGSPLDDEVATLNPINLVDDEVRVARAIWFRRFRFESAQGSHRTSMRVGERE